MEPLIIFGTCTAIALLIACDVYLAVMLWKERKEELKQLWLEIESHMICVLSWLSDKVSRHEECPEWADPDRWNDSKVWHE